MNVMPKAIGAQNNNKMNFKKGIILVCYIGYSARVSARSDASDANDPK